MKATKVLVPMLCLSTLLLMGCGSQGTAGDQTDAGADDAAVEQQAEAEPEPEPAMSNWTENSFYERPVAQIASDLELLGFEVSSEYYDDSLESDGWTYYQLSLNGTPEDLPVEGASETVGIGLTVENPTLKEGETEYTLDTIDEATLPTGFNVFFFFPEADSSEYEALATKVADAVGLGALTTDYVGDPFEIGRIVGNFTYADSYKGVETESMVIVSPYSDPQDAPDPDMPLAVSYGPYVSEQI